MNKNIREVLVRVECKGQVWYRVQKLTEEEARLQNLSLRLWIWKNHPHLRKRFWEPGYHSLENSRYTREF